MAREETTVTAPCVYILVEWTRDGKHVFKRRTYGMFFSKEEAEQARRWAARPFDFEIIRVDSTQSVDLEEETQAKLKDGQRLWCVTLAAQGSILGIDQLSWPRDQNACVEYRGSWYDKKKDYQEHKNVFEFFVWAYTSEQALEIAAKKRSELWVSDGFKAIAESRKPLYWDPGPCEKKT